MMDQDNRAADSTQSHKDNDQSQQNTTLQSTVTTGPVAKGGSVTGIKIVDSIIRAAVHVPGWAWVAGVFLISIAVIIFAALSNLEPIGRTIQALKPTPTAFAPAKPGETLIIVADFEDRSEGSLPTMDPAQDIFDRLDEQIRVGQFDIRVERLSQLVNDSTAQSVLETNGAFLLVWGWYDSLSIKPRLERSATIQDIDIDQEGNVLSLIDSERTILDVKTADLPNLTQYLVMLILGLDRFNNSDLDVAKKLFASAIEQTGDSLNPSQAYLYLGLIEYIELIGSENDDLGRSERAIKYYDKAIELKLDYVTAYNNRGIVYGELGQHERAINDFDKAIALKPDYAVYYYNRGNSFAALKQNERAIADYDQAIALKPDYVNAYYNRGNRYVALGQYERAIADYSQAITLKPDYAAAYYNRGVVYTDIGLYEQAIDDYNKAIEFNPEDAYAYSNRGKRYAGLGQHERAIEDYDQAIALAPEDAITYNNRGLSYASLGQHERAIEDYDQAIAVKPDYALAYNNRGYSYAALGQHQKAIQDFDQVIVLRPSLAAPYYNKVGVYISMGEKFTAFKWLKIALSIETNPYCTLAETDHDFDLIRRENEFIEIMEQYCGKS